MDNACRLWVNLADGRHHEPGQDPKTFLRFVNTGFLVGLPDEPDRLPRDSDGVARVSVRRVDASGLGLTASDLTRGAAICRDVSDRPAGWRCDPVHLEFVDEDATAVMAPPRPSAHLAPPPERTREVRPYRKILVAIDRASRVEGEVAAAAQLARTQGAALVLAIVGELPETATHAEEERAALRRELDAAAAPLADLTVTTRFDMSGDPVHGFLEIADDEGVDLIVVPRGPHHPSRLEADLERALSRRTDVPVRTFDEPPQPIKGVHLNIGDAEKAADESAGEGTMAPHDDHTYLRTHTLHAGLLGFMLDNEAQLIVNQARESSSGRTAKTIVKDGPLRVTVVGLRSGTELEEHRTDAPVLVQVLSGLVRVASSAGDLSLAPGGMVALDRGVSHSVEAQADSSLLLTIAGDLH